MRRHATPHLHRKMKRRQLIEQLREYKRRDNCAISPFEHAGLIETRYLHMERLVAHVEVPHGGGEHLEHYRRRVAERLGVDLLDQGYLEDLSNTVNGRMEVQLRINVIRPEKN